MGVARQRPSVHQRIMPLLDYCGDMTRNSESQGRPQYHQGYSPNNIRCMVISPNGVLVKYHISNEKTGGSVKVVEFNEQDLYYEEDNPKYRPILRMLAVPLVHASIEEIVVLTKSLSGNVHQNYLNEVRPEVLVETFKGAGPDLKSRVANRFGRLRYFTMLDVNFKEFVAFQNSLRQGNVKYSFYSELPAIRGRAQVTELAGEDYWKSYNNKAYYPFDAQLNAHFDKIAKQRVAAERDKAISEKKTERLGGKIKEANDCIEEFVKYSRLWARFYTVVNKYGSNGVLQDLSFVKKPDIVKVVPFEGMMKGVPSNLLGEKNGVSDDEALDVNIKAYKSYKQRVAYQFTLMFFTALNKVLEQGEPEMAKLMLDGCETTICVPSSMNGMMENLGVVFNGRDLEASVLNCCWQFMKMFVAAGKMYCGRDYWKSQLNGERRVTV